MTGVPNVPLPSQPYGTGSSERHPDSPSSAYQRMAPFWVLVETLLGGTPAVRRACKELIPQYQRESDENYKARVARTVLLEHFDKSLATFSSKPFATPVRADVPTDLKPLLEDADLLGHDLTAFSREAFRAGLGDGLTHLLAEMPARDESVQTLEQYRQSGARPYLVHVPAQRVVAAYARVEGGREVLTQVRILESTTEADQGWGETTTCRVRVLRPGAWELWEKAAAGHWSKVKWGTTSLKYIPMVTFYTRRTGMMEAKPPLMALAYKNVEHLQSSSDQRNALTVARFPILAASGLKDADSLVLGPRKALVTEDPAGKIYFVEHTGAAISSGKADLDDLKDEMDMLGAQLLARRNGPQATATGEAIEAEQAGCELEAHALAFADALATALSYCAEYASGSPPEDGAVRVTLDTDFGADAPTAQDLDALYKARQAGEISREAYLKELKRRGVLAADFDPEEDKARMEAEGPSPAEQRAARDAAALRQRQGGKQPPGGPPAGGA